VTFDPLLLRGVDVSPLTNRQAHNLGPVLFGASMPLSSTSLYKPSRDEKSRGFLNWRGNIGSQVCSHALSLG